MKQKLFLLIIIITWGCSHQEKKDLPQEIQVLKNLTVYSSDTEPTREIRFEREHSFGSTNEVLIGNISVAPVVDDLGRVFIADRRQSTIYVFSPEGKYLRQFGRDGRGPGEFSNIRSLHIRKDFLYVHDYDQQKVKVFSLDSLTVDKIITLAGNRSNYQPLRKSYPWIHKILVRNNGTYLAEFVANSFIPTKKWQNVEIKGLLYLLDSTGEIASNKLIEYVEEVRTYDILLFPRPFFGNAFAGLTGDNTIYLAEPDHFLIKEHSPDGIYKRAFYYQIMKIPLTQESAVEAGVRKKFIQDMKFMDLPTSWPVLQDMKIDDQERFWIAITVEDMSVYEWWVLENTGELIAKFTWPREESIEEIKNGYLYTRKTDEENGLQKIVRYRIEMN